ncbi:PhzF family phenazine biosynthesis protein [Haloquadratum walsbyi]|jgi:phenazine biosynthesis protein PhzF family|uniref:Phenazine biosynthesis protein PhzF family n=1 Tax=Haloquadratum walsbyi J07HQW2 TaxID=1238425 RepID=U1NHN4_9EURY|nr:PhzF family phenazine biosynthesis protein [Haloquadratum walsbyi]ERG96368.1 MAG: phenazine biosynthesis protein PhzF family [Haloquadratum walsbyi J07HQW2]
MDSCRALLVDAFSTDSHAGNPAGVIPDADGLSDTQQQAIAAELSASETAFITESAVAERQLRYFSPTSEVDLCGHATIAAHAYLDSTDEIAAGTHTIETNVGVIEITIDDDGTVWMVQQSPTVNPIPLGYNDAADALGIDDAALRDIGDDLPIAVASTGLPFIMIPVNFLEHISNVNPDAAAIDTLARSYDAAGVYIFSFDTLESGSTLHARAFVPTLGITEDPVTGTAAGACTAYLDTFNAFDAFPSTIRCEQGHFCDRPGYIRTQLLQSEQQEDGSDTPPTQRRVRVGGHAVITLDGTITIPEIEDTDILEP